ncbi:MAG: hemin-degrading factor [Flavobacterium sp.]|nr:hemin-degrading factor [Candidatus Neoflavobacterium equi]
MNNTISLKEQWNKLKENNPHLRIRNAAFALGVSEVELLALNINEGVTLLEPHFEALLKEIEQLGKVMALSRNNEAVHERKGVYLNADFTSTHAQLFIGEDIDLRIFLNQWVSAFAVSEGDRKSFQFFGKDGEAIHKIYLTKDSDATAFEKLVEKYKSPQQDVNLTITPSIPNVIEKADGEIDVFGFQNEWKNLQDTHNFFGLLRKFQVSRTQALRLAPDHYYAKPINKDSIVKMLEKVAETQLPIMVFVGNKGIIQIHTGPIKKTLWHEQWFNIMDPDFNLHLDMSKISQTWLVRKPTADGVVTSIEVFNEMGDVIVQFFGKRKPGIPELAAWQEIVKDLI